MKSLKLFILAIFLLMALSSAQTMPQETQMDWNTLSENLVESLKSEDQNIRQAAMQSIIQYSAYLKMEDGVPYLACILCNGQGNGRDARERRMAMVALSKINTRCSIEYIYKGMMNENCCSTKEQGRHILTKYCQENENVSTEDIRAAVWKYRSVL